MSDFSDFFLGTIAWMFNNKFCDFPNYHFFFNVSLAYAGGCLNKHVVRTTCPSRFFSVNAGPPLPGCLSVTVSGHNSRSGIQHHYIPAKHLMLAHPVGKHQSVILLKGDVGQIFGLRQCSRTKKQVTLDNGEVVPFADICLVESFNR